MPSSHQGQRRSGRLIPTLALLLPFALGAQQVPNAAMGYRPEALFDFGEFDDVSIYSGALSLNLPLGPSYPRNAGRSLALRLTHLSSAWTHRVHHDVFVDCVYPPDAINGCKAVEMQPKTYARAGLGWMVSLGELLAPNPSFGPHQDWVPAV